MKDFSASFSTKHLQQEFLGYQTAFANKLRGFKKRDERISLCTSPSSICPSIHLNMTPTTQLSVNPLNLSKFDVACCWFIIAHGKSFKILSYGL